MQFFTTNQISRNQHETPEGYLLAMNCPIARIGSQTYAHGEIPVESNDSGLIFIDRPEAEVFRPETIASFNGKPIVDEHPQDGKITPLTWNAKAVGVMLNPRRGDGTALDRDFLYADLLITNQDAIDAVRDGKRELSAGYDAEYEQLAPGRGRQHNIIGNHVALVDKGRCGPHCAIGDADTMASRTATVRDFRRRLRTAIRTHDEAGVMNAIAELPKDPELMGEVLSGDDLGDLPGPKDVEGHHVTINVHGAGSSAAPAGPKLPDAAGDDDPTGSPAAPSQPAPGGEQMPPWAQAMMQRLEAIEQVVAMLADDGDGDNVDPGADPDYQPQAGDSKVGDSKTGDRTKDRKTTGDRRATVGDSTQLRDGFTRMLSQAEILMPGIQLATFDSAAPAKTTFDAMCSFRRKVLDASYKTEAGKPAIDSVLGGQPAPKSFHDASITCDSVNVLFNAAASLMAADNAGRAHQPRFGSSGQPNGFSVKTPSIAELNKRNSEFYAGKR